MPELLKIDPYLESVYPVEVSDSLSDICRQIGARRLAVAGQQPDLSGELPPVSCPDAAYCDEEALYEQPLPPNDLFIVGCPLRPRRNTVV